jgi:hypothetical protein
MQLFPLEVVESWHVAVNARDFEQLCAVTSNDVELVGPRGSARGHEVLRHWLGRAGFTATPLRWFCGRGGQVVVEQRGRWHIPETTSERVVASSFCVRGGRVVRYQRFEDLDEALATSALTDDDEVLGRS